MTSGIAIVLSILALAVILFVTERLSADLVALLVLGSLALTGLVTPAVCFVVGAESTFTPVAATGRKQR